MVLEEDPNLKLESGFGLAKILKYTGNRVVIETNSDKDSLLFLSDTYYPGWKVKVDNEKSKIYRSNYTFRAVFVPKGKHMVEFIYNPFSFKLGIGFSIIGLFSIVVFEILRRKRVI